MAGHGWTAQGGYGKDQGHEELFGKVPLEQRWDPESCRPWSLVKEH